MPIVAVAAVATVAIAKLPRAIEAQAPPPQRVVAQSTLPPLPQPTVAPSPTTAPTIAPTPTAVRTPKPAVTSVANTPQVIHNAPLLVHSNATMKVGKAGSCGGRDVTVDVRGYPRGCTVFDAVSSGRLKNRRGTVLVVPVSTSEDVSDVAYGLLYVQTSQRETPRFLGLLRGDGTTSLVLRVQNGLIMAQGETHTRYFTFNGRRIVSL